MVESSKKEIKVTGMSCTHCEMRVRKALEAIDGVKSAKADHNRGVATVELSKDVPVEKLVKAVNDIGLYKAHA